jgi:hypothetical protein
VDADVARKLQAQDWNRLGRELVAHTLWRCRLRAWREGAKDIPLGLGKTAQDIVGDVIKKVFAGERTWDPERGELLPTLKRHIQSELDHLWEREAFKRERAEPEEAAQQEQQEADAPEADPLAFAPPDPQQIHERREDLASASARVEALFAAVADEPELVQVLEAIMDGCDRRPRFLADHLKVPATDIHNRLRRLRRKIIE